MSIIAAEEPTRQTDHTAQALAEGLRALAAFVEENPTLAVRSYLIYQLAKINVPVETRDDVVAFTRAGLRSDDATITKHVGDKYAGVDVHFGSLALHVYADREEVCERIVVGTREVTEDVPDPAALAAVPVVSVTKTVEDVEWRCLPLLAEADR